MPSSFRRPTRGRPHGCYAAAAAALGLLGLLAAPGVAAAHVVDPGPVGTADVGASPSPSSSGAIGDDVVGGGQLGSSGIVVDGAVGIPSLPPVSATSFVIADADTGVVLAAKDAHQRLAPASTLKTLTAMTLLPRLKPTFPTMAQSDAPSVDGTKAGIVAGTVYKVGDLFTAMLMMSANDAAVALADANGGLAPTLAEMNAEAASLRADDTVAKTPNGLDAPGQSSSAYDLALIFRAGLGNADFRRYLALTNAAFPAPGGKTFQIQTHDHLLVEYPGMVGGKNGYTVAAQASYVGAATRNGHTIIVAVMRDQPNFWNEVKSLLDWGFAADQAELAANPAETMNSATAANAASGGGAASLADSEASGATSQSGVGLLVNPLPAATATQTPTATPKPTTTSTTTPTPAEKLAMPPAATLATGSDTGSGSAAAAAGGSVPGSAGGAAAAAARQSSGASLNSVLMWSAVGVGGLIFGLAVLRLVGQRRRRTRQDDRYLAGLSRLSALEQVSDQP